MCFVLVLHNDSLKCLNIIAIVEHTCMCKILLAIRSFTSTDRGCVCFNFDAKRSLRTMIIPFFWKITEKRAF